MKKLKFDQYNAIVVLVVSLIYIYLASLTKVDYFNGTIGPQHWCYAVGLAIIIFALILFFSPTEHSPFKAILKENTIRKDWQNRIFFILSVFVYISLVETVGFLLSMIPLMTVIGILFGAKKRYALIAAIIMSSLCYLLFSLLGISLGRISLF